MPLVQILVERGLITEGQAYEADRRSRVGGGSLAESLIALGFVTREVLDGILREPPRVPKEIEETGLAPQFLLNLALKSMHVTSLEGGSDLAEYLKLAPGVVELVLEEGRRKRLLDPLGRSDGPGSGFRYALTDAGRAWALAALKQSQYTGPAPVPLAAYQAQVMKQSIEFAGVTGDDLVRCLSHLVLPRDTLERLGPALNSGKSILLFGASGNGKTSVAEALAHAFRTPIHLPHALEVDGQVIKVFDPALHRPVSGGPSGPEDGLARWHEGDLDPRWVSCRRPVAITGGELTMEMLDLSYDPAVNYYEAPAHIKANGGIFVIDDFGRQRVAARDLLNRWILPLERRIDFLTLRTGKKLRLPFDQLVIFSTNVAPKDLMDEAALRRVQYKFHIAPPEPDDYRRILRRACEAHGLELPRAVLEDLLDVFYPRTATPCSAYHPRFIVEHVLATCRFRGVPPAITLELVRDALKNLVVGDVPD